VAGVAPVTFGASVWLVVLTVVTVSAMYRKVMTWVTDGTGGSGLSEEEFGPWAVKVNAGITCVEYTLTFLVSMAALVTLLSDRYPALNDPVLGLQVRTALAIFLSLLIGWLVNRGPATAARAFGPATLAVLVLLWAMVAATVWRLGLHLPDVNPAAFSRPYLNFTLKGFSRLLALMTGVEVFANLVAAFEGTPQQKSRRAFASLAMVMGTTVVTMLIVGPAIYRLSNPADAAVSVFTQTMDQLLPWPLPYVGTLVGTLVLASACAASAQGLQNLALGLRYRHYIPAWLGQRNAFDVADKPVWLQIGFVACCYLAVGTHEETYLTVYAIGVFVLLSMTGWAVLKRLTRHARAEFSARGLPELFGAVVAALLTTAAAGIIFVERFHEGAWVYLLVLPVLYAAFSASRARLGEPVPLADHLGRLLAGPDLLPAGRHVRPEDDIVFHHLAVPLDGSASAEAALPVAEALCRRFECGMTLITVDPPAVRAAAPVRPEPGGARPAAGTGQAYLDAIAARLKDAGIDADALRLTGRPEIAVPTLARDARADLLVLATHGDSEIEQWFLSGTATRIIRRASSPVLLVRPTDDGTNRSTSFTRLLVCLDGSRHAELVLPYARAIAARCRSEIVILAVPESDAEDATLARYLARVTADLGRRGLTSRSIVTGSGPARTIVAVSESEAADLVLIASQGRGGMDRAIEIGSAAQRVMQTAQCPVLLVFASQRHV